MKAGSNNDGDAPSVAGFAVGRTVEGSLFDIPSTAGAANGDVTCGAATDSAVSEKSLTGDVLVDDGVADVLVSAVGDGVADGFVTPASDICVDDNAADKAALASRFPGLDSEGIAQTHAIMAALLGEHGCMWTKSQTHETLASYAIEEAHELAWAIASANNTEIKEELGDLLLQVVYHASIATDFTFTDVANTLNDKLIRRHPHVFASTEVSSSAEVADNWDAIKAKEKQERTDLFDGIAPDLASSPIVHASKVIWRAREVCPIPTTQEAVEQLQQSISQLANQVANQDANADANPVGSGLASEVASAVASENSSEVTSAVASENANQVASAVVPENASEVTSAVAPENSSEVASAVASENAHDVPSQDDGQPALQPTGSSTDPNNTIEPETIGALLYQVIQLAQTKEIDADQALRGHIVKEIAKARKLAK